ncbi:sigma-54 interaction domain-containing protein [Brevibacillus thermoruber]|uniref:HTH-type transcriptional regulatory protein TyrR n=1 Tax=Brevibacillus thermoruber TaxID=33942 RepID=A0A9X3TRK8_9BACL|nr:sigma 54-interacting transcriptional regulator [Brevibacillus thermoruber]MDA5109060.1 sigma 54-interacting transcriptional regulator [Brevibacillus thermoruber]
MSDQHTWSEDLAILQSLKDDLLVTNTDGIIVRATEKTGQIYDVDTKDLIGKSVYDLEKEGLFTPIVTPMVIKERKKITVVQTTNKRKKLLVTGIPVFHPNGELIFIVSYSHDVTELINLQHYLQVLEEDIERVKSELDMLRNKHLHADGIIANSEEMKNVIDTALRVAEVDATILLLGESGVGKSHIAKFIHNHSGRAKGPFIEVNCGAIPDALFEAELFGYESGAFTGANPKGKMGLAELASGGTLFLDEVGELSLINQVKLLKMIQEKRFFRLGGTREREADFRLIAATNRDLEAAVIEKTFREDLYFRLNVVPITIPPLRRRTEDILPLIQYFLSQFEQKYNRKRTLDEAVIHRLIYYEWKGNVRELINVIERLVVTSSSPVVTVDLLPEYINRRYDQPLFDVHENRPLQDILDHVERQVLLKAKRTHKTTVKMAQALGISQPSVVRKLKKHGIT